MVRQSSAIRSHDLHKRFAVTGRPGSGTGHDRPILPLGVDSSPGTSGLVNGHSKECRRRNAMQRATRFDDRAGAVSGAAVMPSASIALIRHHPQRLAPPGRGRLLRCERKTWLRKCLSMPPTRKKPALWWSTETRLRNLTLSPKTNASLLATSTWQKSHG